MGLSTHPGGHPVSLVNRTGIADFSEGCLYRGEDPEGHLG